MLTRRALFPLLFSFAACAPTTTATPAVAPPAASPPIVAEMARAAAPGATSTATLLAAVPANATFVARINGNALRAAPIYASAVPAIRGFPVVQGRLDDFNARCGVSLLDAIDEVVIARTGLGDDEDVTLAHVRADDAAVLRCVASVLGGKPATMGKDAAVRFGGRGESVAVVVEGVAILGSEANVGAAIKAVRAHGAAVSKPAGALDLGPSAVVSFSLSGPDYGGITSGRGALEMDDRHLAIRAVGGLGSEAEATRIAQQARAALDRVAAELGAAPDGAGEALKGYLALIHVGADGARLHAEMELTGGAEAQAKLVGTLSAVGIYAVQHYLALVKLSEARSTVGAISRDLAAYMEMEGVKGKRPTRFPPSAPPTPARVPSGTKYVPDGSTWSHPTWKAIRFEMDMPSYYSYEVITSKDGKTATVRAHGDLNGDGKLSTIERTLTLGNDGAVVIDPKLVLQDELE